MNRPQDGDLVRVLVDFAEVCDSLNAAVRREAEHRSGQEILSNEEVGFLAFVLRNPDVTIDSIAEATGCTLAALAAAARSLQRRGLLTADASPPGNRLTQSRFRATPTGVALRNTARERSRRLIRYAVADITADDRENLERATLVLSAVVSALGFQELHPSYVSPIESDSGRTSVDVDRHSSRQRSRFGQRQAGQREPV